MKEILCHQVLNTTQNSNFVGVTGVNHEIVSKFSSQQQQNCDLSPVKETSSHSSASSSISRQPAVVVNHQPEVLVDSIRQPKASTEPSFDSVSASSRIVQKRLNAAAADSVRSSKCISSRISTESCSRSESSMKSQTIPSWLSALSNIRNSRDSFHCSSLANSRRSYDIHSAPFSVNDKRINASFQQLQDRHNLSYCVDSISSYALKSSLDSQSTELKQSSQESCGTIFCNILQAASALQPLVMSPNKKDLLIVDSQQNITFYTRMVKRSYINNTYVAPELKFLKVVISRTKYVDSIQVNPTSSSRNSFSNRTENITSLSGISVHNIDSVEESEVLRLVSICVGDQSNNLRDILSINTNSMRLLPYEEVVGVNSKIRGRENILRCYPFSSQTGLSSSSATQNLSLPKYLARSLSKVHGILSALRATIPRFIMYVAVGVDQCNNRNVHNGSRDSSSSGKMSCKCMLMSNDPLPDFYCQWADGCKIRYCLSTGKLAIEAPTLSLRWEGSMAWNMGSRMPMSKNIMTNDRGYLMNQCEDYSGTEMTEIDSWNTVDSLPSLLNKYVLYAQKALQRCFQEEKKKYYGKKSLEMKKEAVKTKTLSGPSVLVVDRL